MGSGVGSGGEGAMASVQGGNGYKGRKRNAVHREGEVVGVGGWDYNIYASRENIISVWISVRYEQWALMEKYVISGFVERFGSGL